MLSPQDNELMCRVGPGTPMGNLMREHWLPGIPAAELPEADGAPIRVRLLGENLVAFRDSSGKIGVVAESCPHRGASMFFGRNEESGLRCVYHGWKFDTTGACTDMPNEPVESNFKHKIQLRAYRAEQRNGMIWVYMGPRETPPPVPPFEYNTVAPEYAGHPAMHFYDCNWVQSLEGDIDSSHIDYLHARIVREQIEESRLFLATNNLDKNPRLHVLPTDYGAVYAAQRQWNAQGDQWYRITQFMFPFYTMIAASQGDRLAVNAWLPLDDSHTVMVGMGYNLEQPLPEERRKAFDPYHRLGGYLPRSSDPLSRYRPPAHVGNDYLRDHTAEKTRMFSGIPRDPKTQDLAMVESMGEIYGRNREHLGTSDSMIITVRRVLIRAAKDFRDTGTLPPTVETPEVYRVRPASVVLPNGENWVDATARARSADAGVPVAFVTAD